MFNVFCHVLRIILLSFLPLMWSCCSKVAIIPPSITTTKTETIIEKDTLIQIQADSTFYQALIECKNGKPVLLQKEIKPILKSNKPLHEPIVELNGNDLLISCELEAEELFIEWKESYIQETTVEVRPQYIPMPLKWWQKMFMWIGVFSMLTLTGYIINVINSKKP